MSRRKVVFWLVILALSAAVTSYLFYMDDWEEKHQPGYKSTDSIQMIVGVFTCYTLIISVLLGGIAYAILERFLDKKTK